MAGPRSRLGELPSRDPHAQAVLGHSVPTKGTAIRQSVRRPADAEGATRRTPFRTLHTPQSSAAYPRSTRGFARGLAERQAQALGGQRQQVRTSRHAECRRHFRWVLETAEQLPAMRKKKAKRDPEN